MLVAPLLSILTHLTATSAFSQPSPMPPPIIYTIAGSDSGGGAGIQADLKTIHSLSGGRCHGCSAVTCLTAQNSAGVDGVHVPPASFLREQLECIGGDMRPDAVKVGMLGDEELAEEVAGWLRRLVESGGGEEAPLVVVDPVMVSTSGHRLIDDRAKAALVQKVFPLATLVTPNKFEAEELLGRKLQTTADVEEGARDILKMGPKAVLIKGGHLEEDGSGPRYAQDYLLASKEVSELGKPVKERPRLCDGDRGVWLRSRRHDTIHTHGTGCTLSSAIATAWAMGRRERSDAPGADGGNVGALRSMHLADACCVAKAYVNAGIAGGVQVGRGPGPVTHAGFPDSHENFPTVPLSPGAVSAPSFVRMRPHRSAPSSSAANDSSNDPAVPLGKILPIVDTIDLVEKVISTGGIDDIQLRFKDTNDHATILQRIRQAQNLCQQYGVRLWINDHWQPAIEAGGCFGIHLGQEDLASCAAAGGLDSLRSAGLALGVSTHSYSELSAALGANPSYVSLGPVFRTSSKDVGFDPQGLEAVRRWRELIPPEVPLVAIGGIGDEGAAGAVRGAGADCVAVIGAVTRAEDVKAAVDRLNEAMN